MTVKELKHYLTDYNDTDIVLIDVSQITTEYMFGADQRHVGILIIKPKTTNRCYLLVSE